MNWLKHKLRAWLGIREPTVTLLPAAPAPFDISPTLLATLKAAGEKNLTRRPFKAPSLPPEVRESFVYSEEDDPYKLGKPCMAFDSAEQVPFYQWLNQTNCGPAFPGYGYLSELTQRSEYRAPTETTASEMTREWIDITIKGKASRKKQKMRSGQAMDEAEGLTDEQQGQEDKIEKLEDAIEEFRLRELFHKMDELDGYFGRGQLSINLKGDTDDKRMMPLVVDPSTIPIGSLLGFKDVEPIWTTPYSYNSSDPLRGDFYKPSAWFVIGKRVHASRLLTFISRPVPDILKPAYNFSGLSMSQLMEPYVFQWLRTRNSVSDLVHNFSVMVLATDMAAILSGDQTASKQFLDRIELFKSARDNQGLTVLDKTREEIKSENVPLANLDKLQAQAQEHMAAPSHIPLVKLTGITPAGLNADSEGEIQVWYDHVRARQLFFFRPHLKHCIDIIQCHLFGEIDPSIGFDFVPLSSPSIKELSEIRKADAETISTYIDKAVISPEEAREHIASDPRSGFDNISGPAPEGPPEMGLAEHGAELEEGAAAAGHDRSEEAAQAAHKRGMQATAAEAKLKPKPKPKK